jgi:hypothetical protein
MEQPFFHTRTRISGKVNTEPASQINHAAERKVSSWRVVRCFSLLGFPK